MPEVRFTHNLPNWERAKSEEYKVRYFHEHVESMIGITERQEDELEYWQSTYWQRARSTVNDIPSSPKCNIVRYEIDFDLN